MYWMRPPELARVRDRDRFDPILEGARHGLSRERSLAAWEQGCADATDRAGRLDPDQARQRFHDLVRRTQARGGGLRPDAGRVTRVQTELLGGPRDPWAAGERTARIPGRTTRVADELHRRSASDGWPSVPGRQTLSAAVPDHRLGFADHRVRGLRDVLQRLGPDHPRTGELLAATAAADRSIAGRATLWRAPLSGTATPEGHALWRVAERHAATLYRQAIRDGAVDAHDPAIESAIERCGAGQPLPAEVRRDMERVLGISLAGARIHTDAVAIQAARALGARAFTVGQDIFFAEGAFAPDTRPGRMLLAHELTHVAQALRGDVPATGDGLRVSQPGESQEQEAEAVAAHVDRPAPSPASSAIQPVRRDALEREAAAAPAAPGSRRAPGAVMRQVRDLTTGPGARVPDLPAALLETLRRSVRGRVLQVGSQGNMPPDGDPPDAALARLTPTEINVARQIHDRASAIAGLWEQVDTLERITGGGAPGVWFRPRSAAGLRGLLDRSTSLCREHRALSQVWHPGFDMWREVVTPGTPGLHVGIPDGGGRHDLHIDPHQTVHHREVRPGGADPYPGAACMNDAEALSDHFRDIGGMTPGGQRSARNYPPVFMRYDQARVAADWIHRRAARLLAGQPGAAQRQRVEQARAEAEGAVRQQLDPIDRYVRELAQQGATGDAASQHDSIILPNLGAAEDRIRRAAGALRAVGVVPGANLPGLDEAELQMLRGWGFEPTAPAPLPAQP
jgi:hypothetical protein